MTNTTISADVSAKGDIRLSDNGGNAIRLSKGFVDVKCNGQTQDVNMMKLALASGAMGFKLGELIGSHDPLPAPNRNAKPPLTTVAANIEEKRTLPGLSAIGGHLPGVIAAAIESVDEIHVQATLKAGTPNPLAQMCAAGKQAGMLRNR